MMAVSIITVFVTIFMMVQYAYLANHTDHDVSFFLSVGLISLVMNLATNAAAFYAIAFLYLAIAVIFICLGFAVDAGGCVAFYSSIGPWFVNTFTATNAEITDLIFKVLSAVLFPVGIGLYFGFYNGKNELAKSCGRAAMFGLLCCLVLLWLILGIVL